MSRRADDDRSGHAATRAAQRAVREPAIEAAHAWGSEIVQPRGRTALVIDTAAVKRAQREGADIQRWVGTTVVVGLDGGEITMLRSRNVRRLRRFGRGRR